MPDTVEAPAEPIESTDESTTNAGPTSLAQYASEVEALTGEKVTNDPQSVEEPAESEPKPESGDEKPSTEETPPEKPEPAPKKEPTKRPATPRALTEEDFKNPLVQGEIDRRAAALERSKRAEAEAVAAETARAKAQQEYDELVELANGPEYDETANAARQKLAAMASTAKMREGLYKEVAPTIREAVIEDLSGQINEGYKNIPEFAYQEVWDALHNSRFDHAGNWLAAVVNGISAIRVADKDREWSDKFDSEVKAKAKEMAEGMHAEFMAEQRTKLPNPDVSPPATDGTEIKRYKNRLELARDIDNILPKIGAAGVRALRESLPEAE